ncbi:MAG: metallophosphoesterase family protein [Saprospiraceae bacterium]|nr:metallophosphoesterase family protein [Saprospiraceae bacterium]
MRFISFTFRFFSITQGPLVLITILTFGCKQKPHDHPHNVAHNHAYSDYGPLIFPSKHPDQVILNLAENPLQAVAVNWRTDTTVTSGSVEVAVATHGPSFREQKRTIAAQTQSFTNQYKQEPTVKAHYHEALIDKLSPGEIYVYRVGIDTVWSEWFQIRIPDLSEKPLRFIYFGDAQNEVKSMWSRVIRQAYSTLPEVDFMLHAGDLINRSNRDREWCDWFYAGSFIHATIPSVMTPGNHEYSNVVLSPQWRPQFNLPTNGPPGLEETCYQINYPDLKVISLDAEQIDESPTFKKAQMIWVDSILENDPRKWTAVTLHYPLFSTKPDRDNPELRAGFKPIFDKYQVDIVLQGHDHAYGRGTVQNESTGTNKQDPSSGTMYVVSVSGPKMYDLREDTWMDRRAANTQLFQIISIEKDTLNYQAFTALGTLYDEFDLVKSQISGNELIDKIPNTPERIN